LVVAQGLAGHGGPQDAGELAGDGDLGDGRAALAVTAAAFGLLRRDA
jgi:hypothetical protein